MSFRKLWLLFVFVFMAACENASETVVSIPNVDLTCESATDTTCNGAVDGNDAFVIMTRSGCGDSANFEPVAFGSVGLSCTASGCSGTVSSWQDTNNNSVNEIISGRMDVCSRIDIGANDATESTGDLSDESSVNIQSGQTITIDSWSEI